MEYDFYYNKEIEKFNFIMIPKNFFEEEPFINLSAEAKILYALLLDRMNLSKANKWLDEYGRVFVYYKSSKVGSMLNCGHDKVTKTFRELESIGLVYRKKQGLKFPDKIYVKNHRNPVLMTAEKSHSRARNYRNQSCDNIASNYTENNNTYIDMIDWQALKNVVKSNISYDDIISEYNGNITIQSQIDEIVGLIVDVVSGYRAIKIDGNIIPNVIAKERYLRLRYEHIKYVIESMANLKTGVKRIDNYVCTALYNATLTCNIADLKGFTAKTGVPLV